MTLWHVDSAAVLKCNGYELESLLAGHLVKDSVPYTGGGAWNVNTGQMQ